MTMNEITEVRGKLEKLLESNNYNDMVFAFNKLQELGNLVSVNRETSNIGDNDTANYYFQKLKREVNQRTSQKANDNARDVWLALKYGIVR
jgi:hypothetical protein